MDDALKNIRRFIDQWFFRLMVKKEGVGPGEETTVEVERLALQKASIAADMNQTNHSEKREETS